MKRSGGNGCLRWSSSASPAATRSYCQICNKELWNKYFMKTHMLKMHGIHLEASGGRSQITGVQCDIYYKELCPKYFLRFPQVHKQNTHGIIFPDHEILLPNGMVTCWRIKEWWISPSINTPTTNKCNNKWWKDQPVQSNRLPLLVNPVRCARNVSRVLKHWKLIWVTMIPVLPARLQRQLVVAFATNNSTML